MRVDVDALKKKIHDSGLTVETMADQIGVDRATIYRKLKRNGETFTIGQIHQMSDVLRMSADEAKTIFLS